MSFDEILHCLSATDQKVIREMMVLFDDIDRQTEKFAARTGLKCKSGCGACCTAPDVETTVAEVLPLAVHLWSLSHSEDPSRPQAAVENVLEAIRSKSDKSICVFYKPDPFVQTQGRCSIYAFRPGLCRLFGFAARQDKHGQRKLVTCKVIKDSQPQACKGAQEDLDQGIEAPLLAAHAFSVANIDPVEGQKLLPINQAIRSGLEKAGYCIQKLKQ